MYNKGQIYKGIPVQQAHNDITSQINMKNDMIQKNKMAEKYGMSTTGIGGTMPQLPPAPPISIYPFENKMSRYLNTQIYHSLN